MLSRLFGTKKREKDDSADKGLPGADWSFLKTDMHSHLIPGIDDGAPTIEDSLALIRGFQAMGYQSLVTTPHIKSDYYPNDPVIIMTGLNDLRQAMAEANITIPIKAAAEYYIDERFMEMMEAGPLLTINNNEVLIEFSFVFEPMRLYDILFKIQTKGYKPIIAHPERYNFYHQRPQVYRELKEKGCLLQLNAISLAGYYGRTVKEVAEKLLKEGLYDYCGSDMHHVRHGETMQKMRLSKSFAQLQNYPFLNRQITV
jgi:protein-tyrosine phosphatase